MKLPVLPPAKPLDKEPEVSATTQTPVPTVVSPPSTPTLAWTLSISPGSVVHLPETTQPQITSTTQSQVSLQQSSTDTIEKPQSKQSTEQS